MLSTIDELKDLVVEVMVDQKAEDIVVMDICDITVIADYFIVCTARNDAQMRAISKEITDKLNEEGYDIKRREGEAESGWILMDWKDIIVHIFKESEREFYDLERVWGDATIVRVTGE